jgi:hypothetical protein
METQKIVLPSIDGSTVWTIVKPCLYRYYRKPCFSNFDINIDNSLLLYYYTKKDF